MGKWLAAAAFLLAMGTQLAFAQMPPPADAMIKSAYGDIERYEGWYKDNPSKNTAKRVLKFLKLSESRLAQSQHQDDPSWTAASERLATIKEEMTALLEGRQPATTQQAAPSQTAQPQQQQQLQQAAPLTVQSGDAKVQAAAADIARIAGQVGEMQPGDTATARKYLAELKPAGDTLRGISDRDAAWHQAARDYNALQKRIVAIAKQTAQQPAQQQPAASGTPDSDTARAMLDLKAAERSVNELRADDVRGERRVLAELNRINAALNKVPDHSQPSWKEARQHLIQLYKMLGDKRIGAIAQALDKVEAAVDNTPSVQFLDTDMVAKLAKYVQAYERQLQVYAFFKNAPAYKEVFERPRQIADLVDKKVAEAKAAESELGDVVAKVAEIEQRMQTLEVPRTLNGQKITPALTKAYVSQMQAAQVQVNKDTAYLSSIQGRTNKIDEVRMRRLSNLLRRELPDRITGSLTQTKSIFEAGWQDYEWLVEFHSLDDPKDPDHRANRFLGEHTYDDTVKKFQEALDWVDSALVFEAAYGPDRKDERDRQRAAVQQGLAKYKADYEVASATVYLEPGVDDPELKQIARETLESGRYKDVHPIVRIATGKRTRRKQEHGTLKATGSKTATYTGAVFEWDEFQARTIEKVGDQYFIFVNDLTYYYRGGASTPLEQWIVSNRFRSLPILKENIDK